MPRNHAQRHVVRYLPAIDFSRRTRWALCALFVVISCGSSERATTPSVLAADAPVRADRNVIAITNVSVVPMTSDVVLAGHTVLLSNGLIRAIGPAADVVVPEGAEQIDGTGRFLMPGLFDMHAHARMREGNRPEDYLRQGVTGIRNMQGEPSHLAFRQTTEKSGPVFVTAGPAIAGYRIDRRHRIVTDTADARAVVREHHAAGYDFIKVYSFLSLDVYNAIVDEAVKLGIPVVGHVSDDVRANRAIAARQSSIEHLYGYFWELESDTSELQGAWDGRRLFHAVELDESRIPEIARRTAEAGVWNCPTLWRKDNFLTADVAAEAWKDPQLRKLGHNNRMKLVKALHDAGAGLLVGTDDRAEIIHEELALFVEAGLTPYESLRAATVNAAIYLGIEDTVGTVEAGKRAHLVLLSANPLRDVQNTLEIVGVFVDGAWMPAASE